MLKQYDTENLICSKFLDLMEKKAFYKIKVKELAEYAGMARCTFYTYFDSTYDVIQKLEDDFLFGLNQAVEATYTCDNTDPILEYFNPCFDYIKTNLRIFRILSSPNGDAAFQSRLIKQSRKSIVRHLESHGYKIDGNISQYNLTATYVASGTFDAIKYWANNEEKFSKQDIKRFFAESQNTVLKMFNTF